MSKDDKSYSYMTFSNSMKKVIAAEKKSFNEVIEVHLELQEKHLNRLLSECNLNIKVLFRKRENWKSENSISISIQGYRDHETRTEFIGHLNLKKLRYNPSRVTTDLLGIIYNAFLTKEERNIIEEYFNQEHKE